MHGTAHRAVQASSPGAESGTGSVSRDGAAASHRAGCSRREGRAEVRAAAVRSPREKSGGTSKEEVVMATNEGTPSGEHGPWRFLAYLAAADLTAVAGLGLSVLVFIASFNLFGCSDPGWLWGTTFIGLLAIPVALLFARQARVASRCLPPRSTALHVALVTGGTLMTVILAMALLGMVLLWLGSVGDALTGEEPNQPSYLTLPLENVRLLASA